jgi:hypothetical protein
MASLEIGQRINVDLFGLGAPGRASRYSQASGTVTELGPGVITVRLELERGHVSDVTVSLGRVRQ